MTTAEQTRQIFGLVDAIEKHLEAAELRLRKHRLERWDKPALRVHLEASQAKLAAILEVMATSGN